MRTVVAALLCASQRPVRRRSGAEGGVALLVVLASGIAAMGGVHLFIKVEQRLMQRELDHHLHAFVQGVLQMLAWSATAAMLPGLMRRPKGVPGGLVIIWCLRGQISMCGAIYLPMLHSRGAMAYNGVEILQLGGAAGTVVFWLAAVFLKGQAVQSARRLQGLGTTAQAALPESSALLEPLLQPEHDGMQQEEDSDGSEDEGEEAVEGILAPEEEAQGLSHLLFAWAVPLLRLGVQRPLRMPDLPAIAADMQPQRCLRQLLVQWRRLQRLQQHRHQQQQNGAAASTSSAQPSLLRAIAAAYSGSLVVLAALKLVNDAINFAGPLLLHALVAYLSPLPDGTASGAGGSADTLWVLRSRAEAPNATLTPTPAPTEPPLPAARGALYGCTLVGLLGGSALAKAMIATQYDFYRGRLANQLRAALVGLVFRKAMAVPEARRLQHCSGELNTLMSVDCDRVVGLCLSFNELWSLPLQIVIALLLLYTQVKWAFVAGLSVVLALIPINRWLALCIQDASERMMSWKDSRIRLITDVLRGVRTIKMLGWQHAFRKRIDACRLRELRALAVRKYLDALCVYFWAATGLLFSVTTFGLYALMGQPLTAQVVFTSIALFGVLISPLNAFPWVLNGAIEALVSLNRIQGFMNAAEQQGGWQQEKQLGQATVSRSTSPPKTHLPPHALAAWRDGPGGSLGLTPAAAMPGPSAMRELRRCLSHPKRCLPDPCSSPATCSGTFHPVSWPPQPATHHSPGFTTQPSATARTCSLPATMTALDTAPGPSGAPAAPDSVAVCISEASFSWLLDPDSQPHAAAPQLPPQEDDLDNDGRAREGGGKLQQTGFMLGSISVAVPKGALVAVVGGVGAGKSSLLCAVLGEMLLLSGRVRVCGSLAYVPQQPWIMSGTIRDNILMGLHMQERWYARVLRGCALDQDLRSMPLFDRTQVGNAGATLSGGQRSRLALARALYHRRDIYLLDEVLAAVDNQSALAIIQDVICGPLLEGRTRIVVTRSPLVIMRAHVVLQMCRGRIAFVGSPDAFRQLHPASARGPGHGPVPGAGLGDSGTMDQGRPSEDTLASKDAEVHPEAGQSGACSAETPAELGHGSQEPSSLRMPRSSTIGWKLDEHEDEDMEAGAVAPRVYRFYLNAVGAGVVAIILASLVLMQVSRNSNDLYLAYWVSRTPPGPQGSNASCSSRAVPWLNMQSIGTFQPQARLSSGSADASWPQFPASYPPACAPPARPRTEQRRAPDPTRRLLRSTGRRRRGERAEAETWAFLRGLLLIAAANSLLTLARAFSFAWGGLRGAGAVHRELLDAVMRAPAVFFDRVPSGRLVNRFSSDVFTVDDSLPFIANVLLANAVSLAGVLLVLCFTQRLLLLLLLPLMLAYRMLQLYYRSSSRELRRLESTARSPVYSLFTEAVGGGPSVRALGLAGFLQRRNRQALHSFQTAAMATLAAAQWLEVRLQLTSVALVTAIALLAVGQHRGWLGGRPDGAAERTAAGLMGLSLTYALPIVSLLNGVLTTSAETEQEMVAVERVLQYLRMRAPASSRAARAQQEAGREAAEQLQQDNMRAGGGPTAAAVEGQQVPSGLELELDQVWMRYSDRGPWALRGLSLRVRAGEHVGCCGRSGAGKSSIVNCLFRLVEGVHSGTVAIGGRDVLRAALPLPWRGRITAVPQHPFLFQGSLQENLDPEGCTRNPLDLAVALHKVGLWEVAMRIAAAQDRAPAADSSAGNSQVAHPTQLDAHTVSQVLSARLGEAGAGLSAGQQQLLCLARTLVRRPAVVVLDECTASVDPDSARAIQEAVRAHLRGATILQVAHDLSVLMQCDRIVFVDRGHVVEQGPPAKLMALGANSLFASLYHAGCAEGTSHASAQHRRSAS